MIAWDDILAKGVALDDHLPVNIYKGNTKVAGWHPHTVSGTGTISLDGAYNVPPDALVVDGKCVQGSTTGKNLLDTAHEVQYVNNVYYYKDSGTLTLQAGVSYTLSTSNGSNATGLYFSKKSDNSILSVAYSKTKLTYTPTVTVDVWINGYWVAGRNGAILQLELGSTATAYEPYTGGIPSPNPDYPQPITSITGDLTITAANGSLSDTVVTPLGSVEICSLPDGTKDTYDAVTGVVTKRVGKVVFDGSADEGWQLVNPDAIRAGVPCYVFLINNSGVPAQTAQTAISDKFPVQTDSVPATLKPNGIYALYLAIEQSRLTAGTPAALRVWLAANPVTVYYKLATPYTIQLTPDLPVVRTGIKTLSVSANITPSFTATVKAMD